MKTLKCILYAAGFAAFLALGSERALAQTVVYPGLFVNVSTMVDLAPGAFFTSGFVVREGSTRVLIRGIGPGLRAFGVEASTDPRLELYREGRLIFTNDDWEMSSVYPGIAPVTRQEIVDASARCGAFALEARSFDSVMLVVLEPGAYTVQAKNWGVAPGAVLLEVYKVP